MKIFQKAQISYKVSQIDVLRRKCRLFFHVCGLQCVSQTFVCPNRTMVLFGGL